MLYLILIPSKAHIKQMKCKLQFVIWSSNDIMEKKLKSLYLEEAQLMKRKYEDDL